MKRAWNSNDKTACGNCSRKLDQRDKCHYGASSNLSPPLSATAQSLANPKRFINGDNRPHVNHPSGPQTGAWKPPVYPAHRPIAAKPASTSSGFSQPRSSPNPAAVASTHAVDSMTAVGDETSTEFFGSSSAGSFTAQIKAAVDARLGHSPNGKPAGNESSRSVQAPNTSSKRRFDLKNVILPTRRLADELMRTYWLYIDPLYPFLNRKDWDERYSCLFAGQPLNTDESIFMASLNIVFALSTQLHEGQDAAVRNDTSQDYFQRAQGLVDVTIWDPGSIETVQYLLITSQYLQSTNSPHQTWMVVGLAVRTAQSLGLHLPETSASNSSVVEKELYRQLWHGCVLMDRYVVGIC